MAQNNRLGNDRELRNVLVSRFGELGNVAIAVPVLYSACALYPEVNFIMLTSPRNCDLFVNHPHNLTLIGIDAAHCGPLANLRSMAAIIGSHRPEAYIDLQNDTYTMPMRVYCALKGLRVTRYNKASETRRALTRRTNKVMLPIASTRERYREAFHHAGMPLEPRFDGLYGRGRHADDDALTRAIGRTKAEGEKWIGIAPFAAFREKEYPLSKMGEVIDMLLAGTDYHIFIFGAGGREKEKGLAMEQKNPERITSLAGGNIGLAGELALMSRLDAMLTMDSANMHLAAIAGATTISVWGATHFYCGFQGWRQSEENMVQVPISCRPCSVAGNKECFRHDRLCLNAIRPETIYQKVVDTVENKTK